MLDNHKTRQKTTVIVGCFLKKKKIYEYVSIFNSTLSFTVLQNYLKWLYWYMYAKRCICLYKKRERVSFRMHCGQKPISDYFLLFPKVKGGREWMRVKQGRILHFFLSLSMRSPIKCITKSPAFCYNTCRIYTCIHVIFRSVYQLTSYVFVFQYY